MVLSRKWTILVSNSFPNLKAPSITIAFRNCPRRNSFVWDTVELCRECGAELGIDGGPHTRSGKRGKSRPQTRHGELSLQTLNIRGHETCRDVDKNFTC